MSANTSRSGEPDLRVVVDGVELEADWTDDAPTTRETIHSALPLEADATRWGEELYFHTEVSAPLETGTAEVPVGALAFWPTGDAVCLFWGPTPASVGDEPRAASPVTVFGQLRATEPLDAVDGGARVRIEEW